MRVLVTGAGGQLGRSLVALLEDDGAGRAAGNQGAALAAADLVALERADLDIADLAAVRATLDAHQPDLVLNAAAYNQVDAAESDPDAAARGNEIGPKNLAIATAERGTTLLHVSSDYVFDGGAGRPYSERDEPSPRSAYGRSKLAGEEAVRARNPHHFIVRTAWVYHEQGRNFPRTILALARQHPQVRVVHDQVGSPTYAPHLAAAILELVAAGVHGTYHCAGSGAASWYELTCALFAELRIDTPVVPVTTEEFPRPAERPRFSVLVTQAEPRVVLPPWREGLSEFCRRLRALPAEAVVI